MRDNAYIFGKKKDGAQENIMTNEQLEESCRIAKLICEEYSIAWDESAAVATLKGRPIQSGDIAKAFGINVEDERNV